jgi:hypothetical protein
MKADQEARVARKEEGKVEAEKARIDSTLEFQWGEHNDRGLSGYIKDIKKRVGLENIVHIPQTREIE